MPEGAGMTRGRFPENGRTLAKTAAAKRGRVHLVEPGKDRIIDALIFTGSHVVLVTLRRSENMGRPIEKIEEDYREPLLLARGIPCGGPVCRELWLYSRYETLRFFRIENAALVELGPDGSPVPAGA